jgi:UDP-N-acetylglucosamine:LPS N-acetylglucosamine transferase
LILLKEKPDVIITTGAHTCVPMCYLGKIFKKKIIYIESFAKVKTPNLSGKLVYPIADLFIVQWPELLKYYPKGKYLGGGLY